MMLAAESSAKLRNRPAKDGENMRLEGFYPMQMWLARLEGSDTSSLRIEDDGVVYGETGREHERSGDWREGAWSPERAAKLIDVDEEGERDHGAGMRLDAVGRFGDEGIKNVVDFRLGTRGGVIVRGGICRIESNAQRVESCTLPGGENEWRVVMLRSTKHEAQETDSDAAVTFVLLDWTKGKTIGLRSVQHG